MSRQPRAGGRYVPPVKQSDGTTPAEAPVGAYTLEANTTYVYIIGGIEASRVSIQLTGYTSGLVITSATVQDTNHQSAEVTDRSLTVGEWVTEDPSTAFVGVDGTGWSVTNAVVAASGAGVGGAVWHISDTGAARTRLAVVVGATGGLVRVSAHGKN